MNPDFRDLLAEFNAHQVEGLVVSAHAVPAPGHVPATKDHLQDNDRQKRAQARRARVILHKARLSAAETDLSPIRGVDGMSLASRLTEESWKLAGLEQPRYTREEIPCRFVPGNEM